MVKYSNTVRIAACTYYNVITLLCFKMVLIHDIFYKLKIINEYRYVYQYLIFKNTLLKFHSTATTYCTIHLLEKKFTFLIFMKSYECISIEN